MKRVLSGTLLIVGIGMISMKSVATEGKTNAYELNKNYEIDGIKLKMKYAAITGVASAGVSAGAFLLFFSCMTQQKQSTLSDIILYTGIGGACGAVLSGIVLIQLTARLAVVKAVDKVFDAVGIK